MQAVKSRDTQPERLVRSLTHRLGYRFRLYRSDLPGKPDLTFAGHRKVIFVHGCFWHGHECPRGSRTPKRNAQYWTQKIMTNRQRDRRNIQALTEMGWDPLVLWECELKDEITLENRIQNFFGQKTSPHPDTPR